MPECRRAGHLAWEQEGVLLCWGGVMEHRYSKPKGPNRTPSCGNSFHAPDQVATYCPCSRVCGVLRVGGEVPRAVAGAVGVVLEGGLLVWGGLALGEEGSFYICSTSRDLHFLEVERRAWSRLQPEGEAAPASEKGVGWSWAGKAYFFSGYTRDGECAEQARTRGFAWEEGDGGGWHSALTAYSPRTGAWSWPQTRGTSPSPRAGAAAAVLGDSVYIFGGRGRRGRMDDLHSLHLPSLSWRQVQPCSWPDVWAPPSTLRPAPRALHSLTALPCQALAMYGGLGQLHAPLQVLSLLLLLLHNPPTGPVAVPPLHRGVARGRACLRPRGGEVLARGRGGGRGAAPELGPHAGVLPHQVRLRLMSDFN